jgi:hypothetical protein
MQETAVSPLQYTHLETTRYSVNIIFQFGSTSPSVVPTVTTRESTTKFSQRPASFTTLRRVPLHPTKFEHCPNSMEALARRWTPLPCAYRMYHLYWRFTRYLNYKKLYWRRPESWITSGHGYKPRNGLMIWTRYFNYGKLHRLEKVSHIGTWLSLQHPVCSL